MTPRDELMPSIGSLTSGGARRRGIRILMLVSDAHGGTGGIARHNCDVIEALAASDLVGEIRVLARLAGEYPAALPPDVTYDPASTDGIRSFIARAFKHGLTERRFDLIHCGHINLMPVAWAIAAARRIPVTLAIHGIEAWSPPASIAARWAATRATKVISVSDLTRRRFLAWCRYAAGATEVIPNTFQAGMFQPGPKSTDLARRLGLEGRTVIMSMGRMSALERMKGIDEVLEIMPGLISAQPGIAYLVCGDGDDRPRLEAKARALNVAHAVRFTGHVPERDKADHFRLADAFVMPSFGEGFGIVILEALSCGIPVVASTVDGTREAILDGELGTMADPRDPAALAAAILAALRRPREVPGGLSHFSPTRFSARWTAAVSAAAAARLQRA